MTQKDRFDVVILGSGVAGSTVGAIAAKAGLDAILVDAGHHPRFAVGESTVGATSAMFELLGLRFGIPEFANVFHFSKLIRNVSSNCGVKRHVSFVHHNPGLERHDPHHCYQIAIPEYPRGPETHLFRQDVDQYLLAIACRYGCDIMQDVKMSSLYMVDNGQAWRLELSDGKNITGRFLVDATGFRSPIAERFGLRDTPPRARTHSRSIFTHMIDVAPYEAVSDTSDDIARPWSQGTLHHVFDHAWMWVIPFNNYVGSTNQLISVGLTLDPRAHGSKASSPEAEFRDFISQYPPLLRQMEKAKPVRNWISTGRIQYSSSSTVGHRYALTGHASGFVDALFSRGLAHTLLVNFRLCEALLDAFANDQFDVDAFAECERSNQSAYDTADRLVATAYAASKEPSLWNTWLRFWTVGLTLGEVWMFSLGRNIGPDNPALISEKLAMAPDLGSLVPQHGGWEPLFRESAEAIQSAVGSSDPSDLERLALTLLERLDESGFAAPHLQLTDLTKTCLAFEGPEDLQQLGTWMRAWLGDQTDAVRECYAAPPKQPAAGPDAMRAHYLKWIEEPDNRLFLDPLTYK